MVTSDFRRKCETPGRQQLGSDCKPFKSMLTEVAPGLAKPQLWDAAYLQRCQSAAHSHFLFLLCSLAHSLTFASSLTHSFGLSLAFALSFSLLAGAAGGPHEAAESI